MNAIQDGRLAAAALGESAPSSRIKKNFFNTTMEKVSAFASSRWGKAFFLLSVGAAGACFGATIALSVATIELLIAYVAKECSRSPMQYALDNAVNETEKGLVVRSFMSTLVVGKDPLLFKKMWETHNQNQALDTKYVLSLAEIAVKMNQESIVVVILSSDKSSAIDETQFQIRLLRKAPSDAMALTLLKEYVRRLDFSPCNAPGCWYKQEDEPNSYHMIPIYPDAVAFLQKEYGNYGFWGSDRSIQDIQETLKNELSSSQLTHVFISNASIFDCLTKEAGLKLILEKCKTAFSGDFSLILNLFERVLRSRKIDIVKTFPLLLDAFPGIDIDSLFEKVLQQPKNFSAEAIRVALQSKKAKEMSVGSCLRFINQLQPENNGSSLLDVLECFCSSHKESKDFSQIMDHIVNEIFNIFNKSFNGTIPAKNVQLFRLPFLKISKESRDLFVRKLEGKIREEEERQMKEQEELLLKDLPCHLRDALNYTIVFIRILHDTEAFENPTENSYTIDNAYTLMAHPDFDQASNALIKEFPDFGGKITQLRSKLALKLQAWHK
ncbi:MAG TPA: hypothetical protein VGM34_02050 [Chlamydiales bacterium]